MKLFKFLAIALMGLVATSCLDNDTEMTASRNLLSSNCFNLISDMSTGEDAILPGGCNYNLQVNVTRQQVSIQITGLQFSLAGASFTITIPDVPFKYNSAGALEVIIPEYTDTQRNISVKNFKLQFMDRVIAGYNSIPAWVISYEVNGQYRVRTIQKQVYYFGTSNVTTIVSGKSYSTTETYYGLEFFPNDSQGTQIKAKLHIMNAQFAPNMPQMNMRIEKIPVRISQNSFAMEAESLDLFVDKTLQPDYAVTDFYGTGSFGTGNSTLNIQFTTGGMFNASLSLGYNMPSEEQQ